jgi:hypothetical protein
MNEIRARAGIFHPVEADSASASTIRVHGVDVPRPNFRRNRQDQVGGPGAGRLRLGPWD